MDLLQWARVVFALLATLALIALVAYGARRLLEGFEGHLNEACVGSISEIFDADAPFLPRGCIAQAWSVAEVLRSWAQTSAD